MTNIKRALQAAAGVSTATDYQLQSWGLNSSGQLGLGNTTTYSSPKNIGSADPWSFISSSATASGSDFNGAIKGGKLFTWGGNASGELGLGNTTSYSSPKQVGSLTDWDIVKAGAAHTVALKTNGTLWTWGNGGSGRLGLGNTTSYSSPKQVGSLTTWAKISAGVYATAAIKTDGTLWTWGAGGYGRLGHGNTTNYSSPVQVGSLTNWAQISVGQYFCIAVKTDGTLWSWGRNNKGQLGLGNTTNYSSPKQIGSLTNWSQEDSAHGGAIHAGCVKTDGTLWMWGSGSHGKLGLGSTTDYSSPKQVGSLTNWEKISLCRRSSFSIKTDGTLWGWGNNASGRLGLGNTTSYSSPKQVGSSTNWKLISIPIGDDHTVMGEEM